MSAMGNCKDCRHWDKTPYIRGVVVEENGREVLRDSDAHHICTIITDPPYALEDELPQVIGWEGDGFIITPPDFGCTLFEAKADEPLP